MRHPPHPGDDPSWREALMSRLILKRSASRAPAMAGIGAEPRPIGGDIGASRGADDSSPHAVSKLPAPTKRVRRGWLWFGTGPEVDLSRANLTPVEELMLNLP